MKFIYACDVHGDMNKYNKLMDLCLENKIDTIVLGGDILVKCHEDRETTQRSFIKNELKDYYKRLKDNKIRVIGILGNDDLEVIEKDYYEMIKEFPNIIDVEQKRIDIDGISFIGLNKVLDAPFKRKDHIVIEDSLEMPKQCSKEIYVDSGRRIITPEEWAVERLKRDRMIDCLKRLPEGSEKTIYILHDPPAKVGLDWCKDGDKAGSVDIYNFLDESKALMSFHGHIHESYNLSGVWKSDINGTIAIQPGQSEYQEELLIYVIVDTDENSCERKEIKCYN